MIFHSNNLIIQINILSTIIFRLHQIMSLRIIKVSHQILHPGHRLNFIKKVKKVLKKEKNYKNKMPNKNLKCKLPIVLSTLTFLNLKKK